MFGIQVFSPVVFIASGAILLGGAGGTPAVRWDVGLWLRRRGVGDVVYVWVVRAGGTPAVRSLAGDSGFGLRFRLRGLVV